MIDKHTYYEEWRQEARAGFGISPIKRGFFARMHRRIRALLSLLHY